MALAERGLAVVGTDGAPLRRVLVSRQGGGTLRPDATKPGGGKLLVSVAACIAVWILMAGAPPLGAQAGSPTGPPVFRADLDHSSVAFSVRHFVTPVHGRFRDFSALIRYDRDDPSRSSVEFRVKAASISTDNDDRDAHLRSAEFFDAARFPELTFASTAVRPLEATRFEVTGDLSIHGVVRRVTLPVTLLGLVRTPQGERIGLATSLSLDRKDYGITWNRVLEGAGSLLGDEVRIEIDVEALRAPDARPLAP